MPRRLGVYRHDAIQCYQGIKIEINGHNIIIVRPRDIATAEALASEKVKSLSTRRGGVGGGGGTSVWGNCVTLVIWVES